MLQRHTVSSFLLPPALSKNWIKRSKWAIVLPSSPLTFFFPLRKLQNKSEVGWLYRKWHAECPGTPPAPLHSGGSRPRPLTSQTASLDQSLSMGLPSNYSKLCSLSLPPSFYVLLYPQNPSKKTVTPFKTSPCKNQKNTQFKTVSLQEPQKIIFSSVAVKGHKSCLLYCFPLHSSSTGLKASTVSQAEQVWLGDDLHLPQISPAPPGGVGRLTLLLHRHTITAFKAIHARSLDDCQVWVCSVLCRYIPPLTHTRQQPDVWSEKMMSVHETKAFWHSSSVVCISCQYEMW